MGKVFPRWSAFELLHFNKREQPMGWKHHLERFQQKWGPLLRFGSVTKQRFRAIARFEEKRECSELQSKETTIMYLKHALAGGVLAGLMAVAMAGTASAQTLNVFN